MKGQHINLIDTPQRNWMVIHLFTHRLLERAVFDESNHVL